MDNLNGKTIKQYYYDTDYGTMCITAIWNKKTKFCEFYGHMVGYGQINLLYGVKCETLKDIENYSDQFSFTCHDEIVEIVENDINDYMANNKYETKEEYERMKGAIKKVNKQFSDNIARINR